MRKTATTADLLDQPESEAFADANRERTALLEFVPDIVEELKELQAADEAAKVEVRRIARLIDEKDAQRQAFRGWHQRKALHFLAVADAELSGRAPPQKEEPPAGSEEEIQGVIRVLEQRKRDAEEAREIARDRVKGRTLTACQEAMNRLGAEYAASARRTAELHAQITGGQAMLTDMKGPVLVGDDWTRKFDLPNAPQIPSLKDAGHHCHFRDVIAGGSVDDCWREGQRAADVFKRGIRSILGGRWPFEKEW